MSSKPNNPRSIASQLVLLFTLAAALLLSCSLGVFYWMVVRHAVEEDNAVLADKVAAIRADLKQSAGLANLTNRRSGEPASYWVRILDSSGRVMTETAGMNASLPPNVFPAALRSTSTFASPKNYRAGDRLFSLVANSEHVGDQSYTIQIAQDRSADENFRKQFRLLFATVLAFGVLAAVLIAISVTRRALRPLAQMTSSVERVGPTHFSERVPPAQWPNELRPLAIAFDDMLDRLEDSFTRLSQFSADLAHELRTPLANILGEAQVGLTRQRSAEEYRETIESVAAECERLSGIVDNLLFLARAEAADRQIERAWFDARAAVETVAAYYQTIAEDRHVNLSCTGQGQVFADPLLFRRALSNVVENALRFTPNEGTINISIAQNESHTEISVRDNGPGIAPEHLPRVFDRFYRADPSRSPSGAGLGLALVKSIVDLHGGSAKIDNQIDGGTKVVLTFPAA
jgi:two-component system heavy metal sensor histidine kinase CusS